MSNVGAVFARLRAEGRVGIVPYVTVGYPTLDATVPIVKSLVAGGADVIELGVPFSDPLADGTTIQRSSFRALQNGTTLRTCLDAVAEIRRQGLQTPILFMGYYNPFLKYGLDRLARDCSAVGLDGFIVPDLPVDEAEDMHRACLANDLDLIFLLAPTSTEERIARVAELSRGFIYCVSLTGVTGARQSLPETLPEFISRVRAKTSLPLAIGFGISTAEHVAAVGKIADGAVVGSALIDRLDRLPAEDRERGLIEYMKSLRE